MRGVPGEGGKSLLRIGPRRRAATSRRQEDRSPTQADGTAGVRDLGTLKDTQAQQEDEDDVLNLPVRRNRVSNCCTTDGYD